MGDNLSVSWGTCKTDILNVMHAFGKKSISDAKINKFTLF